MAFRRYCSVVIGRYNIIAELKHQIHTKVLYTDWFKNIRFKWTAEIMVGLPGYSALTESVILYVTS